MSGSVSGSTNGRLCRLDRRGDDLVDVISILTVSSCIDLKKEVHRRVKEFGTRSNALCYQHCRCVSGRVGT